MAIPGVSSRSTTTPPIIAQYDAVVSISVHQSAVTVVDRALAEQARSVLEADPGYAPWPPPGAAKAPVDMSVDELVAARLLTYMTFGARLQGTLPEELWQAISGRWAKVAHLRSKGPLAETAAGLERVTVQAVLRSDGAGEWGYTHGAPGFEPLPIPARTAEGGRTELDLYLQNVVRADLAGLVVAP